MIRKSGSRFPKRSCSNKKLERDIGAIKIHPALNKAGSFRCIMQGAADPGVEVGDGACAQRLLLRAPRGLAAKRREQSEIDIHRLERAGAGIDRLDMTAGDVAEQRAMRRR